MSLIPIITNSQTGSLDLLATEYKNPPGLANTSGEAIKITITATGQWYLLKPDFATNDPGLVKYKTPVDGDGYARDQNDQKFNFKYPQLNPGALVGEIKDDPKGNTKSTVSGKQQSFELQPKDTISFIINDDPKWYDNNAGKLTIGYSTTPINPVKPTPKGRIVVNSDEWTLSNAGFQKSPDAAKFAINVAKYFVGEGKGKFHALSNNFGLVESSLEQTMTQAGHTWTKGTNITIDLPTLSKYDGIFLAADPVNNQVLIQYVKNGGKVYLAAGTGMKDGKNSWDNSQAEADRWNTFLGEFGLKFAGSYNGIAGNLSPNQSHPLFAEVKSLYFGYGNSITDLKPESPLNQIIQTHNEQGLIATAEFDPTAPVAIADLYNTGVDNARKVLGDSVADSHYTLATYPAGTVTPGVTTPNKDLAPINWLPNTTTARWIGPNTPSATGPVGDYSYKTTFTLPSFSEALIVGELSVDDRITDILINGVSVGNPVPLNSWTNISKFSISKGFVVGTNTIEFKLHTVGGPTGLRIDSISGTYKQGLLSTGNKIKLKSWKGDYLHRPDSDQGVTSWSTGVGNEWTVEVIADNKIKLKSWKGDYLHRPDSDQGVTSWSTGVGNEWTVEAIAGNKIKLKSWKGDYLHRPDSEQGVTTWGTDVGNEWGIEVIDTWAGVWAGGAIISVDGNKLTIDMSFHKRIPATGTIDANDPTKATVTFPDDRTYKAQLSNGKITWFLASNSALWGFWDRSKYWFA